MYQTFGVIIDSFGWIRDGGLLVFIYFNKKWLNKTWLGRKTKKKAQAHHQ